MSAQNKSVPPPPSAGGRNNRGVVRGIIGQLNESSQKHNPEAFLLPVGALQPNPTQPRRTQNEELDRELAEDIKVNGILEPILVRPAPDKTSNYQIIAGERRYRAAKAIGLTEVPVVVKRFDDKQVRLVSLAENLQRAELEPIDEAHYFQILCDEYNYSTHDVANMIHKSKSYVQSRLNLLKQPDGSLEQSEVSEQETNIQKGNGEINNNRAKKTQLLKNSQYRKVFSPKPVTAFTKFLNKVKTQLPELEEAERQTLVEQLSSMQQLMAELEQSLKNYPKTDKSK